MNRIILFKLLVVLIFSFGTGVNQSKAQQKQTVKLNEHFYPIPENDSSNYFYKAIVVNLTDSTSIERIFNRKNQIVKTTRYNYNLEGNFPEENTEAYDLEGNMISKKLINRDNGFFQAVYYDKGEIAGDVLYQGGREYEIRTNGSEEAIHSDENIFEPKPGINMDEWNSTMAKNLNYPSISRRNKEEGTVIIAIYVNEFGERMEPIVANPENVSESLALEALRATSKFEGEITSASTIDGQTVDAWLYIPLRFKLD